MAKQSLFNVSPYYDDYDEDKNFLRMLFRPGYAVQARELTQAQHILQNQIEKFGNHIFEDGAKVVGAGLTTRPVSFVRFQEKHTDPTNGAVTVSDNSKLIGYDIVGSYANVDGATARARVIHALDVDTKGSDLYKIAFVEFLEGSSFKAGAILESTYPSEIHTIEAATAGVPEGQEEESEEFAGGILGAKLNGDANLVSIDDGIFYIDGFFVKTKKSSIVPHGYTAGDAIREFRRPYARVGFDVSRDNITVADDNTLRDPASGAYNFNAPGADRYRINLDINFKAGSTQGPESNFIELLRYEDGDVTYRVVNTQYSEIEKTLARRTYDESGSYTVRPFEVDMREHRSMGTNRGIYNDNFADANGTSGDASKLAVGLRGGKSYVFGHEFETQATEYVSIDKARSTATFTGNTFDAGHGNYFITKSNLNEFAADWLFGKGDINRHPLKISLLDGTTSLATAKIHKAVPIRRNDTSEAGCQWRIHLFDIQLLPGVTSLDPTSGQLNCRILDEGGGDFSSAQRSLFEFHGVEDVGPLTDLIPTPTGNTAGPYERDNNLLLFPINVGDVTEKITKLKYAFKYTFRIPVTATTDPENIVVNIGDHFTDSSDGTAKYYFDPNTAIQLSGDFQYRDKYSVIVLGTENANSQRPAIGNDNRYWESEILAVGGNQPTQLTISLRDEGNAATISNGEMIVVQATVIYDDTTDSTIQTTGIRRKIFGDTSLNEGEAKVAIRNVNEDGSIFFELPHADVYNITSVLGVSGDIGNAQNYDPSFDFLLDDGQRDNEYVLSRLIVKGDKTNAYIVDPDTEDDESETGNSGGFEYQVHYQYFAHEEGPGPFIVDSYTHSGSGFSFDNIPLYTSKNLKKTFSLANVLDFRHINTPTGQQGYPDNLQNLVDGTWNVGNIVNHSRVPDVKVGLSGRFGSMDSSIEENHSYYLSRIDKIVLKHSISGDPVFAVLPGVHSLNPKSPADSQDSMTLYALTVPAYTYETDDVGIRYIENKRYTMRDLGDVDERVNDLEYFTNISLLENEIDARQIPSIGMTLDSAFKNGILVDSFRGHNIGDVSHRDYACSIDYQKGHLRPSFLPKSVGVNASIGSNLQSSDDGIITFKVNSTADYCSQQLSSTTIAVNPFNVANWLGTVSLDSPIINWIDTGVQRPSVRVNTQGENDNWKAWTSKDGVVKGFGSQWNDWNVVWYGLDTIKDPSDDSNVRSFLGQARRKSFTRELVNAQEENISSVSRDVSTTREEKNRLGLTTRFAPNHIQKTVGDKVVDTSVSPFLDNAGITLNAYGMKPNTQVSCFLDNVNINAYCSNTAGNPGPYTTDLNGRIHEIQFGLPRSVFQSGDLVVRFTDDPNNKVSSATTSADGVLYAQGLSRKRDGSVLSTRTPILRRQTVKSEQVIRNPFERSNSFDVSKYTNWVDPLSQVFYVDENAYPDGIFLDAVELCFSSVDSSVPVKVDIRPTVNGVPSPSLVVPFSEVWKNSSEISFDADGGTLYETFEFSSLVYLEPGEYAICISANSANYTLHSGVLGENALNGIERISIPLFSGPLFMPTNSRESEPDTTMNLKYKLHRCIFDGTNTNKTITLKNNQLSFDVLVDEYQLNYAGIIPVGNTITNTAKFDGDNIVIQGKAEKSSAKRTIANGADGVQDIFDITLGRTTPVANTAISPMFDTKYLNLICIENKINSKFGSSNDETKSFATSKGALARYITRRVTLEDGFEAKNLKVFLDLNQEGEGQQDVRIEVYAKTTSISDETNFDEKPYNLMTVMDNSDEFISSDEFDFREVEYSLFTEASQSPSDSDRIKSFAVKICMYRNDDTTILSLPIIKDLRVVALDT